MTRYSDDAGSGPSLSEAGEKERRQEERAKVVSADLGLESFFRAGYCLVRGDLYVVEDHLYLEHG